jgi:hypothetical protein
MTYLIENFDKVEKKIFSPFHILFWYNPFHFFIHSNKRRGVAVSLSTLRFTSLPLQGSCCSGFLNRRRAAAVVSLAISIHASSHVLGWVGCRDGAGFS